MAIDKGLASEVEEVFEWATRRPEMTGIASRDHPLVAALVQSYFLAKQARSAESVAEAVTQLAEILRNQ